MTLAAIEPPAPAESVVATLETALERAKAGLYSGVVVCFIRREDGLTGNIRSEIPNTSTMIGGLHNAIHAMLRD